MKSVKFYEFKDLSAFAQEHVIAELEKEIVKEHLGGLQYSLDMGYITKEKYEEEIGCDEPIFPNSPRLALMAMYYNKHKERIDKEVNEMKEQRLYNRDGEVVCRIDKGE